MCCRDLSCLLPGLQAIYFFIFLQSFLCRHVPEAMQHFCLFASTSLPICSGAVPSWSPWSPSLSSCPCCQDHLHSSAWFPLHGFPHAVDSYFPSFSHVETPKSLLCSLLRSWFSCFIYGTSGLHQLLPQNKPKTRLEGHWSIAES